MAEGAEPEIRIVADADAASAVAAELTAAWLTEAVAARGRADWATTGGSTPIGMYRVLMQPPTLDGVPWADIHVWWGDDRFVHRDHPLSNVKPLDDILLGIGRTEEGTAGGAVEVPLPAGNLHPFPTGEAIGRGLGADWCAAQLAATLRSDGPPAVDGWPVFDLVMLGMGGDGHVLSVFPGSAALASAELCLAVPAPDPHRAARRAGDDAPGGHRGRPAGPRRRDRGRQGGRARRGLRRRARSGPLAGPARPHPDGHLDPRRGGRRRAPRLTT